MSTPKHTERAPRLFHEPERTTRRAYSAHFHALAARFGPFDLLTRAHAGATAVLWLQVVDATRALQAAQEARNVGKGRRPSVGQIERLKRRQGLAWGSYEQAVRRLEELSKSRPTPGILERLQQRGGSS